jgi:hypothetical protein
MPRPRRARREQSRALRKQVRRTETLARQLPGASPANPVDVGSPAVIETRTRATPCLHCEGELELRADRASSTARGVLRELSLVCRRCHAPRTLYFRVTPPSAN